MDAPAFDLIAARSRQTLAQAADPVSRLDTREGLLASMQQLEQTAGLRLVAARGHHLSRSLAGRDNSELFANRRVQVVSRTFVASRASNAR
jgi:hypothetical protein